MKISHKLSLILRCLLLISLLSFACSDAPVIQRVVRDVPSALRAYSDKPEPGTMIAFPPVPLVQTDKGSGDSNLMFNPDFEEGDRFWNVSGAAHATCAVTDVLSATGRSSLLILPSLGGNVFALQTVEVLPRTFYSFSALVFAAGESDVSLVVRDVESGAVLRANAINGPMNKWSNESISFVTGAATKTIAVGLHCADRSNNAPVLMDQCSLEVLSSQNLLPDGTMEIVPEQSQMPNWYSGGEGIGRVPEGYMSVHAAALPLLRNRVSSLECLIPGRQEIQGRPVWISAMVKCVPQDGEPAPDVILRLRLSDADGHPVEVSAMFPVLEEWTEITLSATLSTRSAGDESGFDVLRVERPRGHRGRILVDDVMMFAIPGDDFAGGLVVSPASQ